MRAHLMQKFALSMLIANLVGCSSVSGTYPRQGAVIPDASLKLTTNQIWSLEDLIVVGGVSYVLYKVIDPLAPNWDISEARLADDQILLTMKMKRFYTGGAGEARQTFQRRIETLVRERGYAGYEILSYNESLESGFVPQRKGEGVVQLVRGMQ